MSLSLAVLPSLLLWSALLVCVVIVVHGVRIRRRSELRAARALTSSDRSRRTMRHARDDMAK
jgi:hypothetical protein